MLIRHCRSVCFSLSLFLFLLTSCAPSFYSQAEIYDLSMEGKIPMTITDSKLLFSIGIHTDSIFNVGYKPADLDWDNAYSGNVDWESQVFEEAKNTILESLGFLEMEKRKNNVMPGIPGLAYIDIRISSFKVFQSLSRA